MIIRQLTYTLGEGSQVITDIPNLRLKVALKIKREGMGYHKVLAPTTNTDEVFHDAANGQIRFNVPGNPGGEKVYVLIKE